MRSKVDEYSVIERERQCGWGLPYSRKGNTAGRIWRGGKKGFINRVKTLER